MKVSLNYAQNGKKIQLKVERKLNHLLLKKKNN